LPNQWGAIVSDVVSMESKEDKRIRETAEYAAKLHKAMYDAHIRPGFSHEDALYLCCTMDG
jgi:hypothetical protein